MVRSKRDTLFFITLLPFSISLLAILLIFTLVVAGKSLKALEVYGTDLFTSSIWDPENIKYGLLSPVVGSLTTSLISIVVASFLSIPLSVVMAEYLKGFSKKLVSGIVEFMGGLPTIIFAIWAAEHLVPFLKNWVMEYLYKFLHPIPFFSCKPVSGASVFAAGIALGISMVPYVASIIFEAYDNIPLTYREACYGIGAMRYEKVMTLLSLARPAVIAALVLGFARSLGETTIVVVTVGNSTHLTSCLFAPGYTVSALVASQFANAYLYPYAESVLYASMLIVLLISMVLSLYGCMTITQWRRKISV